MFNLDQAISAWRRQLAAGGIKTPEVLDELESHLRDDVEQQVRSGTSEEQAFNSATQQIGQTNVLKVEFNKVGLAKWWQLPIKLKGMLIRILGREQPFPFPDLNTFTPRGLQTLELAREEAPRLGHDFIGTEHVLLGLMKSEDGIVLKVLRKAGVDNSAIKAEIERFVGVGPVHEANMAIPYTPRARKALHLAAREANALNHVHISTGHIFLGLLLENEGVAGHVLRNLGVQTETTREAILKDLAGS
ncbi:Clp protease N-terminal domain-containing protein [Pedosphaera parvula]|uniref:Clp domain protein n=1 Tax=Pedosphaera parvula (strain Ellin514) TaxID=320771 RepID=B9XCL2_PEDPL|nr:Clp protease N-terminal domain-containing protein [Pedosphaera parvula]EEF62680.1 Clp domain protein [Pedosphaera parvula Ellin514]